MPDNVEKLGKTFHAQMIRLVKSNSRVFVELGDIDGVLSLVPDHSPGPIPKGEYSICRTVLKDLKKGDRVLIVWCGTEPVVVDAIE